MTLIEHMAQVAEAAGASSRIDIVTAVLTELDGFDWTGAAVEFSKLWQCDGPCMTFKASMDMTECGSCESVFCGSCVDFHCHEDNPTGASCNYMP